MDLGGINMQIQVRQARKEDAQQMLSLYTDFTREFVGPALRDLKTYRRMMRRKDRTYFVAINEQGKMLGYVLSRFDERRRQGSVDEIVVNPKNDYEQVAKPLIDKACNTLIKKKAAMIVAGSFGNLQHEKIFPTLGFLSFESTDVFMYAILNTQAFLNGLAPVFVSRLKRMEGWNGLMQIECDGHSVFIQKTKENIDPLVWSNQPVDFKVTLNRDVLIKLVFGVTDSIEANQIGQLEVETVQNQAATNHLLRTLFPKRQFAIMDYW